VPTSVAGRGIIPDHASNDQRAGSSLPAIALHVKPPMLTSAITAAITAVLVWLGVPPGPYIAGVWIAVKILLVALVALAGWRATRRRSHTAPPPTG
jgi:O-antigen/teichoic acid export membrane protein